jgi:hypothetical protein
MTFSNAAEVLWRRSRRRNYDTVEIALRQEAGFKREQESGLKAWRIQRRARNAV